MAALLVCGLCAHVQAQAQPPAPSASREAAPAPADVPWRAAGTTIVVREAKTFRSAGASLSGTLYLPSRAVPVGVVVVTHAASLPLRDASLYRHLTQMLPAMGTAVFVYDRRGSGGSGGDLQTSDYNLLADDAIAAAHMLAADPRIDARRIGAWGLSQGGWLTLLAASRDPIISYAVSIAAPVVTSDVQMMYRSTNVMTVNGYPPAEVERMRAARRAVDDYMRGRGDRETAQRLVDDIRDLPWFKDMYMGRTVGDRETSRWRREIEHDPLQTLGAVKVPALVLFGGVDPVVPVAASMASIRSHMAGRANLRIAVIADANHALQIGVDPKAALAAGAAGAPNAPEYFAILSEWLTRQGATTPETAVLPDR